MTNHSSGSDRDAIIRRHLRRWATTDFAWGVSDCSIVLADYVLDAIGRDGAAHLRGHYGSRDECAALTGLDGGLLEVVSGCCERAGLIGTATPCRGDIGVLRFRQHEFSGLFLGDRWAIKSIDGLLTLRSPKVIQAWAV